MCTARTPSAIAANDSSSLGIIPPGDDAVGDRLPPLGDGEAGDARGRVGDVAKDARDVGDEDERLRVERDGDAVGDDVGVDVVDGAALVGAEAREDRHVARVGRGAR